MSRVWAMPSIETFTVPPIRDLLTRYVKPSDTVVDPFARDAKWGTVTNDINPATSAQHHMDALDFLKTQRGRLFDGALIDPPFSARQVKEIYEGFGANVLQPGYHRQVRDEIAALIKPDGYVISFGWNSGGIGKTRGFAVVEVMIVPHGGKRNDTIVTVERKR